MVTAELATIAPFAVVVVVLLAWVVSLGLTQVRLTDAAREGARLVARGEAATTATMAAERHAPEGSTVRIEHASDVVEVRIEVESRPPIPFFSGIGARTLSAESTAVMEGS